MGRILKGYWDCPQCKTKGIDGGADVCPSCGKRKDSNVKHYLDMNQKVAARPDEIAKATAGPNWICEYCDGSNRAGTMTCSSCGAAKSEKTAPGYNQIYRTNRDFQTVQIRNEHEVRIGSCSGTPGGNPPGKKKFKAIYALGLGLALIFLCYIFGATLKSSAPSTVTLQIENFLWEREIKVDELRTYQESGWSVPTEARLTDTKEEIHHYNEIFDHYETRYRTVQVVDRYETRYKSVEVLDHYETRYETKEVFDGYDTVSDGVRDLGNGYFEEVTRDVPRYRTVTESYQEPVYKTVKEPYEVPVYKDVKEPYEEAVYRREPAYQHKYYYDIDRYAYSRSNRSSGTDTDPYWQELSLEPLEKESGRLEIYEIATARNDKGEMKKETYEINYNVWAELRATEVKEIEVKFGSGGKLIIVKPELLNQDTEENDKEPLTGPFSGSGAESAGQDSSQTENYLAEQHTDAAQTDGIVVTEGYWKPDGEKWNFIDSQGQKVENKWVSNLGSWFFIDQNGVMVTGWKMIDNHWYLLYKDGTMVTGWNYVNSRWYYLADSGALLTDTITPDGYQVNESGEWIE